MNLNFNHQPIDAVLFDLDGTLLDTIPDLLYALNQLRGQANLPELTRSDLKPVVSLGSKAMLKMAFNCDESHPQFLNLCQQFLDLYLQHVAKHTEPFPEIDLVLSNLEKRGLPWGIVTNKITTQTIALLKALNLDQRASCIICGDSLAKAKPDPLPVLHACQLLKKSPERCLYIGDAITDVIASKAAGTSAIVALYGYINALDDPYTWGADGYIEKPIDILKWLE